MWGAIIQAIDHAAERTQKGFRSGIDVANSQHGGAASVKNSDVSTSKPTETKDVTEEEDKASTEQSSAGSATGAMKGGAEAGAGDILGGATGGAGAGGGEGIGAVGGGLSSIISDERLKARELANSVKRKWHEKVLSDENAKNSRNVSAKRYATNASGSVAEAGRIATGQSSGGNRIITNDNTAFKTASDIQSEVNRKDASKKAEESITK